MVVDFCSQRCRTYNPLLIDGTRVERISSFKYLRVHISEDLSWTIHTDTVVKKARQCLYHLRQLSRFKVSQRILISFHTAAIQSILTGAISVWYSNSSCGGPTSPAEVGEDCWADHGYHTSPSAWLIHHTLYQQSQKDYQGSPSLLQVIIVLYCIYYIYYILLYSTFTALYFYFYLN